MYEKSIGTKMIDLDIYLEVMLTVAATIFPKLLELVTIDSL